MNWSAKENMCWWQKHWESCKKTTRPAVMTSSLIPTGEGQVSQEELWGREYRGHARQKPFISIKKRPYSYLKISFLTWKYLKLKYKHNIHFTGKCNYSNWEKLHEAVRKWAKHPAKGFYCQVNLKRNNKKTASWKRPEKASQEKNTAVLWCQGSPVWCR